MDLQSEIERLNEWICASKHTVFFGGAGVSTESGVPDFRSPTGIYAKEGGAEHYLTVPYMSAHPEAFYSFYRTYFMLKGIEPNAAHKKLAEMEASGKLDAVITQNVDGLHQKAGSKNVLELHGNGQHFYCMRCLTPYTFEDVDADTGVSYCKQDGCGGIIRPDIVMYGESLDQAVIARSVQAIERAELLIVGGTSLTVYPAAGFLSFKPRTAKLVLINLDQTPYDDVADLTIHAPIGSVFEKIQISPIADH